MGMMTRTVSAEQLTNPYRAGSISSASTKEAIPFSTPISEYQNNRKSSSSFYKVVLPTNGTISINTTSGLDVQFLYLYNQNSKVVPYTVFVNYVSLGAKVTKFQYHLQAGTYYINYWSNTAMFNYCEGEYTFSLDFDPVYEISDYHSIAEACMGSDVPWNQTIYGQFESGIRKEIYKINVSSPCTICVESVSNLPNFFLVVWDSNSQKYRKEQGIVGSRKTYINLESGTYYLQFYTNEVNGGRFTFSVNASIQKVSSVKLSAGKKKIVVTANKNGNISGYEIKYKTGSSKWKTVKVPGNKDLKKTIKKLKSKKKYKVQVRTYVNVNGQKQYSAWSKTKKIKVK